MTSQPSPQQAAHAGRSVLLKAIELTSQFGTCELGADCPLEEHPKLLSLVDERADPEVSLEERGEIQAGLGIVWEQAFGKRWSP